MTFYEKSHNSVRPLYRIIISLLSNAYLHVNNAGGKNNDIN